MLSLPPDSEDKMSKLKTDGLHKIIFTGQIDKNRQFGIK